jgi:signal transduction histidine kinase
MEGTPSTADKLAKPAELESDFQLALEAAKLEAMAEFAAGAGHEINNPLTVISGRAQLLLRDETDPERRHALALIVAQATRVYEMIADMMLFARPPQPELKHIELIALIDGVVANLMPLCEGQNTAMHRTGEPGPIFIEADASQLNVAIHAMCRNAIEALQSGGHIKIVVEADAVLDAAEGREVRIRIHDDGPGLKPDEREHIFDPFYSARQAGRGLGLGLSKAWRIVGSHGGRIDVESQFGHGTTFTIVLNDGSRVCPISDR